MFYFTICNTSLHTLHYGNVMYLCNNCFNVCQYVIIYFGALNIVVCIFGVDRIAFIMIFCNCRILCSIYKRIMFLQYIHYLLPMLIFRKGTSTSLFSLFILFLIPPLFSFSKGLNITTYSSWLIPLKLRKSTFSSWKCEYFWRKCTSFLNG